MGIEYCENPEIFWSESFINGKSEFKRIIFNLNYFDLSLEGSKTEIAYRNKNSFVFFTLLLYLYLFSSANLSYL